MNPTFPLPADYFAPIPESTQESARWKLLGLALVQRVLRDELEVGGTGFASAAASIPTRAGARAATTVPQQTAIDSTRWKLLREKDTIRVYRRRRAPRGSRRTHNRHAQSVLALGVLDGSLEDVLYGLHHSSTQELRATTTFLSRDVADAALLQILESGTERDPFRSLALKWRIRSTPTAALLAKPRDCCLLEYMGLDLDARGRRYAFHVSESVEHPVCPPFDAHAAVRATTSTRMLYRELRPGKVTVFFMAEFNLGGRLPVVFAQRAAAEVAFSLRRVVACAEAKKLTMLALTTSPFFQHQRVARANTDSSAISGVSQVSGVSQGGGASWASSSYGSSSSSYRRQQHHVKDVTACSICTQRPSLFSTASMSWCKICGTSVCSKCQMRGYLLTDERKVRVSCCKQCVVTARHAVPNPREPLRLIPAYLLSRHASATTHREGGGNGGEGDEDESTVLASSYVSDGGRYHHARPGRGRGRSRGYLQAQAHALGLTTPQASSTKSSVYSADSGFSHSRRLSVELSDDDDQISDYDGFLLTSTTSVASSTRSYDEFGPTCTTTNSTGAFAFEPYTFSQSSYSSKFSSSTCSSSASLASTPTSSRSASALGSASTSASNAEPIVLLESADMPVLDEEDDASEIPTLEETARPAPGLHAPRFLRHRFESAHASSRGVDPSALLSVRSLGTPSVAKRESQSSLRRETERLSLYSQMRHLRDRAEDVYSLTRAHAQEYGVQRGQSNGRR